MKYIKHLAEDRGHAAHGWLNSWHSFSFGGFHNPEKMHFGALRVLNDDTVKGGMGFSKHPHDNMEIISIPLSGDLHHIDSTGRDRIIKQYDVQIMSAGSGIAHSETNANTDKEVKFLQIWILPKLRNIEPTYDQKNFLPESRKNILQTVVAPDSKEALRINQDAWLTLGNLDTSVMQTYHIHKKGNGVYIFLLEGNVLVNDIELSRRDAVGIWEADSVEILPATNAEILIIEIPMLYK